MKVCKSIIILVLISSTICCAIDKAQQVPEKAQRTSNSVATTALEQDAAPKPISPAHGWLNYGPAVVELKGTLTIKRFFGPPNYGEDPKTDSIEDLPFLILSEPINVQGNTGPDAGFEKETGENIREMGLVLSIEHEKLIGKTVQVKGSLFHGFTGHHHTDVLMEVQSIELAPSK